MTEQEARQKHCPIASTSAFAGYNGLMYCVGSECMAWRWGESKQICTADGCVRSYSGLFADDYCSCGGNLEKVEHGYCGLVGAPSC